MPKRTKQNQPRTGFFEKLARVNKKWVAVAVFALVGTYFTLNSFAATSTVQIRPNTRFAWLLQGAPNETIMDNETGPKVYDFDYQNSNAAQIARIKAKGIRVVCYFSAGTDEDWRPDHGQFTASDRLGALPDWDGEQVVDTRSTNVRNVMYNRIQTMSNMGCDGIEPDNIDAYTNLRNIPLNEATSLDYLQYLSNTAHSFNMAIALKNGADLINKRIPDGRTVLQAFDFALVEECYQYSECDAYRPFVSANKAVFIVEYRGSASAWAAGASCKDANTKNFDAYLMNLNLNGPRTPCRTSGGSTDGGGSGTANLPPAVSITSPTNGQIFAARSTVTLAANASDSDGAVNQVQFLNGNTIIATDTAAPYSTTIGNLAAGTYTLVAVATDNVGARATSTVVITVNSPQTPPPANISPSVNLLTPPATVAAPATITLAANASDSDGTIGRVQFYSGATLIGEDTTSPYSATVRGYQAGTYTFTAVATDDKGATTTSNRATVIVTNPSTTPVSGAGPVWPAKAVMTNGFDSGWWRNRCSRSSTCKIYVHWPAATDDKKVTGYEVWRSTNGQPAVKLYVNAPNDRYYSDKIAKGKPYTYQVYAVDQDGNRAAGPSKTVNVSCTMLLCRL